MDPNNPNNTTNPPVQNSSPVTSPTGEATVATSAQMTNPISAPSAAATSATAPTQPIVTPSTSPSSAPAAAATQPQVAPTSPPQVPPLATKKKSGTMLLLILLVVVFVGILGVAAWYFQSQLQKQAVQKPVTRLTPTAVKPLVIGSDTTYPPMESVDSNGKFVGYDIDLGNLIAKGLGTTAVFKTDKFDDIFNDLDKKKFDIVISSVTITDERKKKYDFSDQYINAGEVVITKKISTQSGTQLLTAKDLQGKKIGVEQGTTEVANAAKLTAQEDVMQYASNDPALTDLINGKIDAVLTDLPNAKGIVSTNPSLAISSDPLTDEYYGIVFRKGDPRVNAVNQILSTLSVKGILTDLKQKWLD